MRYAGIGQNGGATQVAPEARFPMTAPAGVKEIPYDYVATFRLTGIAGRRTQDVINISTEGTFIAVAVGYSFVPAPITAPPVTGGTPGIPPTVNGLPMVGPFGILALLPAGAFTPPTPGSLSDAQIIAQNLTTQLVKAAGIDFKYSVVDSGTGRELQNQAIHNIAGLGSADGDRPFRPFARPALFVPRTSIRIEVEEISAGSLYKDAQLFIVLHGYKRLGE
jgi:hypothetical protein